MHAHRWRTLLLAVLVTLAAAVAAGSSSARVSATAGPQAASGSGDVNVGIIYSRTGLLAAYGAQYIQGLRYGIAYATKGTGRAGGRKINLNLVDDAGDPAKAVTAAKDMIGQGYKIIAGTVSSGVALQLAPLADQNKVLYISGPAASDAITGINRYTFRSGRQTYQDVATADAFLTGVGRKIVVLAQDSVFGAGNAAAVNAVIGGKGHTVTRILVPLTASDFTPFAQQVKQANPDLLFVAWAGTTGPAMWRSLDQQGAFGVSNKVVTGLAERATWEPAFGDVGAKIDFLSHYVSTAPKTKANDFLVKAMKKRNQVPDIFTPDGFVAGQMMVRAIERSGGGENVDAMISALEGWSFFAPKGQQTIRRRDHAMLQPMFQVKLVRKAGKYAPQLVKQLKVTQVAPPERR